MTAPRVALVGARRSRQGLGPYVARHLLRAGALVPCFLAPSEESAARAESELAATLGRAPRGYVDLERMLREQSPNALAILSPHATHARYLEAALAAGLHCLCEKPLVWGEADPAATAARLVAGFEGSGLTLFENCQLPYLLDAYCELHPEALAAPPRSFEMRLSPISTGVAALVDTLHHPLSILQTLAPAPGARLGAVRFHAPGPEQLEVRFRWGGSPGVDVVLHLQRQAEPPRDAALAVNGAWAVREIREPGYRMWLRAGARTARVLDPVERLVGDFVRTLQGAPPPALPFANPQAILQRMELLTEMVAAFAAGEDSR